MDSTHVNHFLFVLGRTSLEAGIMVVLVLAAQWLFRKHLAPRWRCALWFLVMARLLLPFSFGSVTSVFNLLPLWTQPVPAVPPQPARIQPVPAVNAVVNAEPSSIPDAAVPAVPESVVAISQPAWSWSTWLFVVWLAGVICLTGHVVISSVRFWRRCNRTQPLRDAVVMTVLEVCCGRLGVRTPPVLLESSDVSSPALHGLFRPRLLLPKGFTTQYSATEMRFVFLHELAHLKRRDLMLNWFMAAFQAIHWFNPCVWFGFARWRSDRELACDAMALEAAGEEQKREYGRTILRLLESCSQPITTPGLVGILEGKRQLRRRIDMIVSYVPARGWPRLALALALGLAAVGLTDAKTTPSVPERSPTAHTQDNQEKGPAMNMNLTNHLARVFGLLATAALSDASSAADIEPTPIAVVRAVEPTASRPEAGVAAADASSPATSALANQLIGSWVLVGTPGKVGKAPSAGGRMKFFTGKYSFITQADPKTGVVLFHHGGTYSVNGNEYTERVQYANPTTMNFIGGTNGHFTIKIEGDLLTMIGIGNPWKEVWQRAKASADSSPLAKDLVGAWVLVGKPGEVGEPPEAGGRFKFVTTAGWSNTQADPKTGVVMVHHGGTYKIKGNEYVETVDYANPGTMNLIGHSFKFATRVEGDTLTLTGVGNPWIEVWKRAN